MPPPKRTEPTPGSRLRIVYDLLITSPYVVLDVSRWVNSQDSNAVKQQLFNYGLNIVSHSRSGPGNRGILWENRPDDE